MKLEAPLGYYHYVFLQLPVFRFTENTLVSQGTVYLECQIFEEEESVRI